MFNFEQTAQMDVREWPGSHGPAGHPPAGVCRSAARTGVRQRDRQPTFELVAQGADLASPDRQHHTL